MRDKHDAGIKQMCSSVIRFGRSKSLQSCSNFTLKPERFLYAWLLYPLNAYYTRTLVIRFERSKSLQSCSNFTLKPELEPTVIAYLAGRDAQEVFMLDLSEHRAAIQNDCDSCQTVQCRYPQNRLFRKNIYLLE